MMGMESMTDDEATVVLLQRMLHWSVDGGWVDGVDEAW